MNGQSLHHQGRSAACIGGDHLGSGLPWARAIFIWGGRGCNPWPGARWGAVPGPESLLPTENRASFHPFWLERALQEGSRGGGRVMPRVGRIEQIYEAMQPLSVAANQQVVATMGPFRAHRPAGCQVQFGRRAGLRTCEKPANNLYSPAFSAATSSPAMDMASSFSL